MPNPIAIGWWIVAGFFVNQILKDTLLGGNQ
jgi:hypothetical protein